MNQFENPKKVMNIFSFESTIMSNTAKLPIEKLTEEPYASIICYPRVHKTELKKRLKELRQLNVNALEFKGEKQIHNLHLLGKGCVGLVATAYRKKEKVAIKIRRVDADRPKMQEEAELLRKANLVNVGPRLLDVSRNFLLMQFIHGKLLPKWIEKKRSKTRIRKVLQQALEQCWRLDRAGLDHGELSHAPKHIIIDENDRVFIVDFESASANRKPSNVTSISQYLFISGIAGGVFKKLGKKNKETIVEALRHYKNRKSRENFERVLEACGL
jgi:putative serine/threonine protein kinase